MVILYHLKITLLSHFSDELQAFKAAFDMFDKNGDGTISTKVNDFFKNTKLKELNCLIF